MFPPLLTLPNLSAPDIHEQPLKGQGWPKSLKSKEAFSRWVTDPTSEGLFFSAYEGLDPHHRVSSSNPPFKMRAIIADYDTAAINESLEDAANDIRVFCARRQVKLPNLLGKTFSGGLRAIWFLDKPLLVHTTVHDKLLTWLKREMVVSRMCDHLDDRAWSDTAILYCSSSSWVTLDDQPLAHELIQTGLVDVSSRVSWVPRGTVPVPLDKVKEALDAKFPGRWRGSFELGARGLRFWDPTADNPSAAIVRETGMQCFTGPRPFASWSDIFGSSFVKEYAAQRIGGAVEDAWFDGQKYWLNHNAELYDFSRADFTMHLRSRGLSNDPTVGGVSEVEAAMITTQTTHRIEAAVPLPFFPKGINMIMAKKYLNMAGNRNLIEPHGDPAKWGKSFPRLSEFLDHFFEKLGPSHSNTQLAHFLAWVWRWYNACAERKPKPGQAFFIAGPVEQGKTFPSNVVLSKLMGGHADCASYLLGETGFTGHLFDIALWTIDDTRPSQERVHANYSALIKKMPANQMFLYNDKFVKAKMIPWLGRIMVTCNLDQESLRILPDVDQSLLDKIMLTKAGVREGFDFERLIAALGEELPKFARWLTDWDPRSDHPDIIEASRYGVAAFHHPELLEAAKETTSSHTFYELLHLYWTEWFKTDPVWTGNATTLIRSMNEDDTLRPIVGQYTPRAVGRFLAQLSNQGMPITPERENGMRGWRILKEDFIAYNGARKETKQPTKKEKKK